MSLTARLLPFLFLALFPVSGSLADEDPVFVIGFADGRIQPPVLEVPAGRRFKLELHNNGASPVEFESIELRKEKVLAPVADSFVVIAPLDPGEYKFFDDFHQQAQGVIVAR